MDNTIITLQGPEEHRPSPPFTTAYDKGAIAAAAGDSEADCPYDGPAWRNAWLKGFQGVMQGIIEVEIEEDEDG